MTVLQLVALTFPLIVPVMLVTAVPTSAPSISASKIATINAEGRAIDDLAQAIPALQSLDSKIRHRLLHVTLQMLVGLFP